jgi:hypothetical protein
VRERTGYRKTDQNVGCIIYYLVLPMRESQEMRFIQRTAALTI